MNNIIKIANFYISNQRLDMVKTAGILTALKNKIWSYFDTNKANEIEELITETSAIKPLLKNTYEQIKKVEKAIDNLDLHDYNTQLELLKIQLQDLNSKVEKLKQEATNKTKDIKESDLPKSDNVKIEEEGDNKTSKSNKSRKRDSNIPDMYIGARGKTLSDFGVTMADIKENKAGIKPLYASMALCEVIKNGEKDTGLLLHNQQLMKDDDIKQLIYSKLPDMTIVRINGRELRDDGEKKPGLCELEIEGDFITLPSPFQNYRIKPKFFIVDLRRDVQESFNFKIYRQLIVAVKKDSDTYRFNPTSKDVENTTNLPGYNVPPKSTTVSAAKNNALYTLVSNSINKKTLTMLKILHAAKRK